MLACFYLLTNGHTPREVAAELDADEKLLRRWLVKLDNLHLVELRARLGARLRVHAPISWREDGPIRRTYEQQVREEFMRSSFLAQDETLQFRSAEMSEASRLVLQRKLARLTADFNELAELDRHLPSREKRSVALMLACRPWVFSMFDGLRTTLRLATREQQRERRQPHVVADQQIVERRRRATRCTNQ